MDFILHLLGSLTLSAIVLGIVLVACLRWKWKAFKLAVSTSAGTPSKITLTEDPDPRWLQKSEAVQLTRDLEAAGFVRSLAFTIDEMPQVRGLGLTHPSRGLHACLYHQEVIGTWIDLCATMRDGVELTITSAPMGAECDTRPETHKVFLPGKSFGELLQNLDTQIKGREPAPLCTEVFKATFEASYARDMAWRNSRVGVSKAEFHRIATRKGETYTADVLEQAYDETKLGELRRWGAECVAVFEKTSAMPVSQWHQYKDRIIILREDFHPPAYLTYLSDIIELSPEQEATLRKEIQSGSSCPELLKRIAAEKASPLVLLGTVEAPIKVEIYGVKEPASAAA